MMVHLLFFPAVVFMVHDALQILLTSDLDTYTHRILRVSCICSKKSLGATDWSNMERRDASERAFTLSFKLNWNYNSFLVGHCCPRRKQSHLNHKRSQSVTFGGFGRPHPPTQWWRSCLDSTLEFTRAASGLRGFPPLQPPTLTLPPWARELRIKGNSLIQFYDTLFT